MYLVLDTEVTGLDPLVDEIMQVCVLQVGEKGETLQWYNRNTRPCSPGAKNVHKISDETTKLWGVDPSTTARMLAGLLSGKTVIGHCIHTFDCKFLNALFQNNSIPIIDQSHWIDTAAIYKGRLLDIKRKNFSTERDYALAVLNTRARGLLFNLQHISNEFGIEFDASAAHEAKYDCHITSQIYERMLNNGYCNSN